MRETEEHNVAILREAYALWNEDGAGEKAVHHWLSLIEDDVDWRSLGDGAPGLEFTRSCSSKADLDDYFGTLAAEWELMHYTPDEFVAQGDRVVMLGNCGWRHRHTGKTVETAKVDVIRMRDSKVVGFFELYDTAKAIAATV